MAPFDHMKDIHNVPSIPSFSNQRVHFFRNKTLPSIQPSLGKVVLVTQEKYQIHREAHQGYSNRTDKYQRSSDTAEDSSSIIL